MSLESRELSRAESEAVLLEEEAGCLCLSRDGEPYGVFVSHAFIDGKVVFHCALSGRKLDFLKANPRVCYVVTRHPEKTKPHRAEGRCDYRFESVQIHGRARVLEEPAERLVWLRKFKEYYYRKLKRDPEADPVGPEAAAKTLCVLIEPDRMTGRRKG